MFGGTHGLQQPFNRFFIWFIAQFERPVMHREHELRSCLVGHRKRLFRIAVCMNPGVVGPNRHDGQVYRLRGPNLAKHIGRKSRSPAGIASQRLPSRDVGSSICSLLQFAAVIQKLIERFGIIE
jgi:hypothetical protein